MKLKCQPEDFRVEELTMARPDGPGRYTFYRLSKRDLGTIEAVEAICRRWNLSGRRVSYAGLKDRHARTIQYFAIVERYGRDRHDSLELGLFGLTRTPPTDRGNGSRCGAADRWRARSGRSRGRAILNDGPELLR
jgi:tRNA pseudouridine13 synthase